MPQRRRARDKRQLAIMDILVQLNWQHYGAGRILKILLRLCTQLRVKPGGGETGDKRINEADRVVFGDILLDGIGKEHHLVSIDAAYVIHQPCSFR